MQKDGKSIEKVVPSDPPPSPPSDPFAHPDPSRCFAFITRRPPTAPPEGSTLPANLNASVVSHNRTLSACTDCNTAVYPAGHEASATAFCYYILKYVTKNPERESSILPVVLTAVESLAKFQQKDAFDSQKNENRSVIRLATRLSNSHRRCAEIGAPVAVAAILEMPSSISSHETWRVFLSAAETHVKHAHKLQPPDIPAGLAEWEDGHAADPLEMSDDSDSAAVVGDDEFLDAADEEGNAHEDETMCGLLSKTKDNKKVVVYAHDDYRYRGPALEKLNLHEYKRLVKVVPKSALKKKAKKKPGKKSRKEARGDAAEDEEASDASSNELEEAEPEEEIEEACSVEPHEQDALPGQQAPPVRTSGRPRNGRFPFDSQHPLAQTHEQCLRSKQVVIVYVGRRSPHPRERPKDKLSNEFVRWNSAATKFATMMITLFCPWDLQRSCPNRPLTYESLLHLAVGYRDSQSPLENNRFAMMRRLASNLTVNSEWRRAISVFDHESAYRWPVPGQPQRGSAVDKDDGGIPMGAVPIGDEEDEPEPTQSAETLDCAIKDFIDSVLENEEDFPVSKALRTKMERTKTVVDMIKSWKRTANITSGQQMAARRSPGVSTALASSVFSASSVQQRIEDVRGRILKGTDNSIVIGETSASTPQISRAEVPVQPTVTRESASDSENDIPSPPHEPQLNQQQRNAHDEVLQWAHAMACADMQPPALMHTLIGGPGTGKSFVAERIINGVSAVFADAGNQLPSSVVVAAPTGVAASAYRGGRTLHSLLGIGRPKRKKKQKKQSSQLDAPTIRLSPDLTYVKLIVIDEIFMAGSDLLEQLDRGLRQLFAGSPNRANLPFGGVAILGLGDPWQLPPVGSVSLISESMKNFGPDDTTSIGAIFSRFKFQVLSQQMRAQNDHSHTKFLDEIRNLPSAEFQRIVLKRLEMYRGLTTSELRDDPNWKFAPILVTNNYERCQINCAQLKHFAYEHGVPVIRWRNPLEYLKTKELDKKHLDALYQSPVHKAELHRFFAVGAPVFLSENISPQKGLANGTAGTLHSIVLPNTMSREQHEKFLSDYQNAAPGSIVDLPQTPHAINIRFDELEQCLQKANRQWPESDTLATQLPGVQIRAPLEAAELADAAALPTSSISVNTIPTREHSFSEYSSSTIRGTNLPKIIVPLTTLSTDGNSISLNTRTISYQTFEFELGFCITYHKVQGRTMSKVILDFRDLGNPAIDMPMFYVGLSRVRSKDDIRILNLTDADLAKLRKLKQNEIWQLGGRVLSIARESAIHTRF